MRGNSYWRAIAVLATFGAVIAAGVGSALAGPVIYEGFDYTVGQTLVGKDGGTGFSGPWATNTGTQTINADSLTWGALPVSGGQIYSNNRRFPSAAFGRNQRIERRGRRDRRG